MSGIYIPGMEMPTNCKQCAMLDWDLCYIKCKITGRHFKMTECWRAIRVPDCPLIPVPDHGRLVDANEMPEYFVTEGQRSKRYKLGEKWELNGEEIRKVIAELPTVIPADKEEA